MSKQVFKKRKIPIPDSLFVNLETIIGKKMPNSYKKLISIFFTTTDYLEKPIKENAEEYDYLTPYFKMGDKESHITGLYDPVQLVYRWATRDFRNDYYLNLGIIEIGENASPNGGLYLGLQESNFEHIYSIYWDNAFGDFALRKEELEKHFLLTENIEDFIHNIFYSRDY